MKSRKAPPGNWRLMQMPPPLFKSVVRMHLFFTRGTWIFPSPRFGGGFIYAFPSRIVMEQKPSVPRSLSRTKYDSQFHKCLTVCEVLLKMVQTPPSSIMVTICLLSNCYLLTENLNYLISQVRVKMLICMANVQVTPPKIKLGYQSVVSQNIISIY